MLRTNLKPSASLAASQDLKIERLKKEIEELEKELIGHDAEKIVKAHIELLHTYNERKDAAQALIGKYAILTGSTVTRYHQENGLSLTE